MFKLRFLILFVLIAANKPNYAQTDTPEKRKFNLVLFYTQNLGSNIQPKGWKTFVETYNEVTAPKEKLTNFKNAFSFDAGLRFGGNSAYASITYQHTHRRCSATFEFEEQRVFDLYTNAMNFAMGGNIINTSGGKLKLGLDIGLRLGGDIVLTSGYKYRDGFISYGGDKALNGVYNGLISLGCEVGTRLNYKLFKGLCIEASAALMANNNVASSSFTDLSGYKALNSGGLQTLIFPADYKAYDPVNPGYPELKAKLNGYKLNLGLAYAF